MTILVKLIRLTALAIWLTLRVIEAILSVIIVTLAWLVAPKAVLAIRLVRPKRTVRRQRRSHATARRQSRLSATSYLRSSTDLN